MSMVSPSHFWLRHVNDLDTDWERLGNPGWDWKTYEDCLRRVATYAVRLSPSVLRIDIIQLPFQRRIGCNE